MDNEALFQNVGAKNRLVHRVVAEIERLITTGQLAPGMKLPPEREFAETLGVSRTVVREAMHTLTAKGLLASRHGSGHNRAPGDARDAGRAAWVAAAGPERHH